MYCPYCGTSVSDTAKFCYECGGDLREQISPEPVESTERYIEEPEEYIEIPEPEENELDAEDEARFSRENRKTVMVGVILAALICTVGIGLWAVASHMLKQEPKIDVGSGLNNKTVQVTPVPENTGEAEEAVTEEDVTAGQEDAETSAVTASVTSVSPEQYGYTSTAGIAYSEESSVLEDGGVYHNAAQMLDGRENTSWQEASEGDGTGEWVRVQLDRPYSVRYLTFRMGNWRSEQLFYANNRPERILLRLDEQEFYLDFPDGMTVFTVELSQDIPASQVLVQVQSVYRGASWNDCCISEMTVYGS